MTFDFSLYVIPLLAILVIYLRIGLGDLVGRKPLGITLLILEMSVSFSQFSK